MTIIRLTDKCVIGSMVVLHGFEIKFVFIESEKRTKILMLRSILTLNTTSKKHIFLTWLLEKH